MSVQLIDLNLSEEAYKSNQDSVITSDNDSKMTPITARTLEQTFERRKASSYEDVDPPSSKEPNISKEKTETVPPTTFVPPSISKGPTKNMKNPTE